MVILGYTLFRNELVIFKAEKLIVRWKDHYCKYVKVEKSSILKVQSLSISFSFIILFFNAGSDNSRP